MRGGGITPLRGLGEEILRRGLLKFPLKKGLFGEVSKCEKKKVGGVSGDRMKGTTTGKG